MLRVIQWATGSVGRHAVAAVHDHPDLELVGALAYSDAKAGRVEAGTVAAQRFGYTAMVDGRRALTVEHITRLGDEQAKDWPTGRGWKVTV